jgi:hypothetical protein
MPSCAQPAPKTSGGSKSIPSKSKSTTKKPTSTKSAHRPNESPRLPLRDKTNLKRLKRKYNASNDQHDDGNQGTEGWETDLFADDVDVEDRRDRRDRVGGEQEVDEEEQDEGEEDEEDEEDEGEEDDDEEESSEEEEAGGKRRKVQKSGMRLSKKAKQQSKRCESLTPSPRSVLMHYQDSGEPGSLCQSWSPAPFAFWPLLRYCSNSQCWLNLLWYL